MLLLLIEIHILNSSYEVSALNRKEVMLSLTNQGHRRRENFISNDALRGYARTVATVGWGNGQRHGKSLQQCSIKVLPSYRYK